eukprot:1157817-Pelagomonas_calceolata.AAC.21
MPDPLAPTQPVAARSGGAWGSGGHCRLQQIQRCWGQLHIVFDLPCVSKTLAWLALGYKRDEQNGKTGIMWPNSCKTLDERVQAVGLADAP